MKQYWLCAKKNGLVVSEFQDKILGCKFYRTGGKLLFTQEKIKTGHNFSEPLKIRIAASSFVWGVSAWK